MLTSVVGLHLITNAKAIEAKKIKHLETGYHELKHELRLTDANNFYRNDTQVGGVVSLIQK